jgi:DNA polymerase III epsilon subunit-like protein
MIFADIETTGVLPGIHDICSIGACLLDKEDTFYVECKIPPQKVANTNKYAMKVNGFTKDDLLIQSKLTTAEAYKKFLVWCTSHFSMNDMLLAGINMNQFDAEFLKWEHERALTEGIITFRWPFGYRFIDVHTLVWAATGLSANSDKMSAALDCEPEQKPHNALNGALHTRKLFKKAMSILGSKND